MSLKGRAEFMREGPLFGGSQKREVYNNYGSRSGLGNTGGFWGQSLGNGDWGKEGYNTIDSTIQSSHFL